MDTTQRVARKIGKITRILRARAMNNGISAFWWSEKKNFGDLLTPELILAYGYTPIETPTKTAEIIGVGSLIEMIPREYRGVILGTGLIKDSDRTPSLDNAKFAAVRGELTKKNLGLSTEVPTGDLGLLARKLLKKTGPKKYRVGFMPHFVDKKHPWIANMSAHLGSSCCIIDVQDSAHSVISQAARCELIISSSLHGIIISDSLGIDNVWVELSDNVIGSGFKFWDYNSSIDYEQPPLRVSSATSMIDIEKCISTKSLARIVEKSTELEHILKATLKEVALSA